MSSVLQKHVDLMVDQLLSRVILMMSHLNVARTWCVSCQQSPACPSWMGYSSPQRSCLCDPCRTDDKGSVRCFCGWLLSTELRQQGCQVCEGKWGCQVCEAVRYVRLSSVWRYVRLSGVWGCQECEGMWGCQVCEAVRCAKVCEAVRCVKLSSV